MITSTPHFGFTIGAEKIVLDCISSITTMAQKLESSKFMCNPFEMDSTISQVLSSLEFCRLEIAGMQSNGTELAAEGPRMHPLAQYQLSAFIFATHIYLYRMLLGVPPKRVAPYVSLVFQNVSAFMAQSAGNFSLWPAFIAAVEAYRPEDLECSRAWMHRSTRYGQGNRVQIAKIIQEVWRRRDEEHEHRGIDKGLVAVDWRQVVRDLDFDILLV